MSIAEIVESVLDGPIPLGVRAYDGSSLGPPDPPRVLNLRTPRAASYLATAPGELGLARAYVSGDLDVEGVHPGDPYDLLVDLASVRFRRPTAAAAVEAARTLGVRGLAPPPPPPQEALPRWRRVAEGLRHSTTRDAEAISHHYDVSNKFYEWVLGPSMTYTCACFPTEASTLEEAQEHKYDLVCQKIGLKPGMRLLDVGCGWGGLAMHAARHYGADVLGITLSQEQAQLARKRVAEAGLTGVEI
ncbi:MAG: class I SAM-dependent methyltransferase, partial [Ornithinibacter sp.]